MCPKSRMYFVSPTLEDYGIIMPRIKTVVAALSARFRPPAASFAQQADIAEVHEFASCFGTSEMH